MNEESMKNNNESNQFDEIATAVETQMANDEKSTTNVYNATVNNTNIFYSTIACINFMRANRKALIIPAIVTLAIFIMLGISIATLNKSLRMYEQAQTVSTDTMNKMNELTERNEQLEKAVREALESSKNAAEAAGEAKKQAEDSVKKLSEVANQPKQSASDSKPKAAESEATSETIAEAEEVEDVDPTVYLSKMTIVSNYNAKTEKTINNSLGDELKDAVVINGYGGGYVTYYLGGKYTKFKGNVCCPEDHSITKKYPLTIYANDDKEQELYSMDFGRNTAITPIELDVSGVEFLTFRVHIDTVLDNYAGVIITDGVLE